MNTPPRGWSRSRPALQLLLVVALAVGSVLTAVLWWFGTHETARLEIEQHEFATRTGQLAEVLLRNRLERGQTVLRAIAASRAVQDALVAGNVGSLTQAIQPFQSEFASTMVVIDGANGKPMAASTPLAYVLLGIDTNSVEGRVHQALSVAAGDLVMRFEQPIEAARRPVGRLRGAVTLGRVFVQQLSRDLRTPLAVFVDGKVVHHTFASSPSVPLDARGRAVVGSEEFDFNSH
ncbi:MAG: cache domain-containing protein, partial [Acidobacteriota bacterium]